MSRKICICVGRDPRYPKGAGLQMSIEDLDENGGGTGYRIAGPKFSGRTENLMCVPLDDERTIKEIRSYLTKAMRRIRKQKS